jgi:CBS domain-containing protein
MFFRASRGGGEPPGEPIPLRSGDYTALRNSRAHAGERYDLPIPDAAHPVRLESPATEVMTDLRRVSAVTVGPRASIVEANRAMVARGVRALFVVDEIRQVLGIITATDILGERPMQFAQARGIRHDEIAVRDIMTPADRLEMLQLRDVLGARVGDVVATLRFADRQHALVVDADEGTPDRRTICGIFSLTQIGRRLGIPAQQVHDIARTFAEIEALIAAQ